MLQTSRPLRACKFVYPKPARHKRVKNRFSHSYAYGFSLLELMVTLVIASILTVIAVPSYLGHVQRSKMRTAQADLAALAVNIENEYQRKLAYPVINTTQNLKTLYTGWNPASETFSFTAVSTNTGYTLTATGTNNISGCVLKINNQNVRTASGCPQGNGNWI